MRTATFIILYLLTFSAASAKPFSITINPFQYDGEYQDGESHLLYLKARYLHQELGIAYFITRDFGEEREEKTLSDGDYNSFADDPIMNEDPSGHMKFREGGDEAGYLVGALTEEEDVALSAALKVETGLLPFTQIINPKNIVAVPDVLELAKSVNQKTMETIRGSSTYFGYLATEPGSSLISNVTSERRKMYAQWLKQEGRGAKPWPERNRLLTILESEVRSKSTKAETLKAMESTHVGNCGEMARYNVNQIREIAAESGLPIDARVYRTENADADHAFAVVFRYGQPEVIIDSWLGRVTPIAQKEKIYGNVSYREMNLSSWWPSLRAPRI